MRRRGEGPVEEDDEKKTRGRRQEKGEGFRGMTEGEGEGMRIHAI